MRFANRDLEDICGGSPALVVRELDIEVDLDVSDVVPVRALGLLTGAGEEKAGRLGSFDGNRVNVQSGTSGDGDEQQLDRCELTPFSVANRQRAAA